MDLQALKVFHILICRREVDHGLLYLKNIHWLALYFSNSSLLLSYFFVVIDLSYSEPHIFLLLVLNSLIYHSIDCFIVFHFRHFFHSFILCSKLHCNKCF